MTTHIFTLILAGPNSVTTELEELIFQAGCDDAALGERDGTVYLEFDREADSFREALLSAIDDLRRVPGIQVARIEPDDLLTASEIADRTGRSRESIRLLARGDRGGGGFPQPVSGVSSRRTRLWRWNEVANWLDANGIPTGRTEEARLIAALNGALDLIRNSDLCDRVQILERVGG